jgi:hypothetical protein
MSYTGTTATTFTGVTRGVLGTAAAAHSNGAKVFSSIVTASSGGIAVMALKNDGSVQFGTSSNATGSLSIAGPGSQATSQWATAFGPGTTASGAESVGIGWQVVASGQGSFAAGRWQAQAAIIQQSWDMGHPLRPIRKWLSAHITPPSVEKQRDLGSRLIPCLSLVTERCGGDIECDGRA